MLFHYRSVYMIKKRNSYLLMNIVLMIIIVLLELSQHGIICACKGGSLKIVEKFVGADSDIATLNEGLGQACAKGHLEVVDFLLTVNETKLKKKMNLNHGLISACKSGCLKLNNYRDISKYQSYQDEALLGLIQMTYYWHMTVLF